MPTPLSRTRKTTSFPSTPAMSWMRPPDGVYLAALLSSRFVDLEGVRERPGG